MFKHLFLKARQHQTEKGQAICGCKLYTILGTLRQWPGAFTANATWPLWISSPDSIVISKKKCKIITVHYSMHLHPRYTVQQFIKIKEFKFKVTPIYLRSSLTYTYY